MAQITVLKDYLLIRVWILIGELVQYIIWDNPGQNHDMANLQTHERQMSRPCWWKSRKMHQQIFRTKTKMLKERGTLKDSRGEKKMLRISAKHAIAKEITWVLDKTFKVSINSMLPINLKIEIQEIERT